MKHARADHRVTDFETRLLAAIADRVDVDTGETEQVTDAVLAIESCAKSRVVVCKARHSLKRKGYLDWRSGPVRLGKGHPNIYWLPKAEENEEGRASQPESSCTVTLLHN